MRLNLPLPDEAQAGLPTRLREDFKTFAGRRVAKVDRTDGCPLSFDDGSWILIRPSGTEPVAGIDTESTSPAESGKLAEDARAWIVQ